MRYNVIGKNMPAVEIELVQGEQIFTQGGSMLWADRGIEMKSNLEGGLLKGIGRMFSGGSLFMVDYTCNVPSSKITFGGSLPGTVFPMDLGNNGLICQKSAFLCAQKSVNLDVVFKKDIAAGIFGGEGFILQKISGTGTAFIQSFGDFQTRTLNPEEELLVDTGHIVAFDESVTYSVELVKGVKNIFFGGEGLFFARLKGPGRVFLQTMTAGDLANDLAPFLMKGGNSSDKTSLNVGGISFGLNGRNQ